MSKSPNIFWPALGITGIVLGAAYGLTTRGYKAEEAEAAMARATQAEARAEQVAREAADELAAAQKRAGEQLAKLKQEMEQRLSEARAQAATAATAAPGEAVSQPATMPAGGLGLGRPALDVEIAAWDVNVMPDGRGLPEGSGDVATGEELFSENCAACHGEFAEGVDNWPPLAGGFGTLDDKDPVKTVGSYWPYLSTVWDYVHRSMPFGNAQSLTPDEVYAITAYILYSNDLVDEDFELNRETFLTVEMPNKDGFIIDDRPQTEYPEWRTEPCMQNCKAGVEITMRASVLDVTPDEGKEDTAAADQATAAATQEVAAAETSAAAEQPAAASGPDPELVAAGEKVFRKCKSCHQVGPGAKNRSGPELNGVVGRPIGSVEGFRYSAAFKKAHDAGRVWDEATLAEFLAKPKAAMPGTKMSFAGLRSEDDIKAVIAYLEAAGQ